MSEPLRLCVVGDGRTPHVVERARVFAERGHRVCLVSEEPVDVPGIEWRQPRNRVRLPKLRVLGRARAVIEAIDGCHADVVHVHFAHGFPAWVAPAARTGPLVVSVMGGDVLFDERQKSPRDRRLTTALLRAADLITAKSQFLSDAVASLAPGVPRRRAMWGVDTRLYAPGDTAAARRQLGIPDGGFVVLSPRGLSPLYNIEAIVAGFATALGARSDARLLIVEHAPDADYARRIRERVAELGLSGRAHFLPGVPAREMPVYYAAADVVVSAPLSDGLPQTLLEAMACGRPHVLPPLPRYRELVENGRDALFAEATPEGLGAAFARLAGDPALRLGLGEQARATILREADRESELAGMERTYREIVASARPRSLGQRLRYLGGVLAEHLR
jgi:glycosyltransferase involved in cell wall biosynthesis